MATGFLKSTGYAVASHNLGPRAAVHLPTVLTGPESKLYLKFGRRVFDPLTGPKEKIKNRSVNLWRFVFSTSLPNFIFNRSRMKTKNRLERFYRASSESEYSVRFTDQHKIHLAGN